MISYSCNTLGAYVSRLHANAGIEGGSAQTARRTLAVKLHRKGYDLVHIAAILGHKSVSTTKRLVTQDPVRLGDIVAKVLWDYLVLKSLDDSFALPYGKANRSQT